MKREFPFYIKQVNIGMYPSIGIIEVTETGWTEIKKTIQRKTDYIVFEISKNVLDIINDPSWETSYWHKPEYMCTKEKYDSLKFEFLNWVDENFER